MVCAIYYRICRFFLFLQNNDALNNPNADADAQDNANQQQPPRNQTGQEQQSNDKTHGGQLQEGGRIGR